MKKTTFVPPYTSVGEFVKFINSVRVRRPDPLTLKSLEDIDVGKSNAYTLFGALKSMGLYDEKGRLLQRDELNGLASRDEQIRRESFKRILERTYQNLMEKIPVQEATVEKVRHEFAKEGAAPSIAIKAARLFIWFATQAGFETAEEEFTPYKLEKEKNQRRKTAKKEVGKKALGDGSIQRPSQLQLFSPVTTVEEEEDRLLNTLQEKLSKIEGVPPIELVQVIRELIDAKRERSKRQQASEAPETVTSNNGEKT